MAGNTAKNLYYARDYHLRYSRISRGSYWSMTSLLTGTDATKGNFLKLAADRDVTLCPAWSVSGCTSGTK